MTQPPLLQCTGVVKAFGGLVALNRAGLTVNRGEIVGLVGPNGSGKTTMINVISGQIRPDAGQIVFDGQEITGLKPSKLAHLGLARTFQIPRPFASRSVLENVALAAMFGSKHSTRAEAEALALKYLDFVGMTAKAYLPISAVTLHDRKFLEIARALALEPRLLMLDEVLAGLNPAEVIQGIGLIQRIRDLDIAVLFVEHNMTAVHELCSRVVVFDQGAPIAEGVPQDVMRDSRVVKAYLGDDYAHR